MACILHAPFDSTDVYCLDCKTAMGRMGDYHSGGRDCIVVFHQTWFFWVGVLFCILQYLRCGTRSFNNIVSVVEQFSHLLASSTATVYFTLRCNSEKNIIINFALLFTYRLKGVGCFPVFPWSSLLDFPHQYFTSGVLLYWMAHSNWHGASTWIVPLCCWQDHGPWTGVEYVSVAEWQCIIAVFARDDKAK